MTLPDQFGKYEIRRVIGRGAMGVVYEGFDPVIRRAVAIKAVRLDSSSAELVAETLARARREAQAAGRLNHVGIVAVYDYGEEVGEQGERRPFIAMELVDGRDLRSLLESGHRFDPAQAAALMTAVLAALQHAHERGVVHRDIKPGNLLLLGDGSVKITDFGVAHLEGSDLTMTGAMIGTPQYMAPEQLLGQTIDGRADLFACGAILYELLAGRKAFSGSYASVVQKLLNEDPEPPSRIMPGLAPGWDSVLRRALAKDRAERFQSAAEFAAAIRQVPLPTTALPDDDATVILPRRHAGPTDPRTAKTLPAALAATVPPVSLAHPGKPRRWPGLAAGLAVAAVVAAGGYALWPRERAGPPVVTKPLGDPAHAEPQTPPPVAAPPAPVAESIAPPPPHPPTPLDEWQRRWAELDPPGAANGLADGLTLLLDLRAAKDKALVAEFEQLSRPAGNPGALAFGTADGRVRWAWSLATGGDATAERSACAKLALAPCSVVMSDGRFQPPAFRKWSRSLGSRSVAEVRAALLRALNAELPAMRTRLAEAKAPAPPPPAAPPVATPVPATPVPEAPRAASTPPAAAPAPPASRAAATPPPASRAAPSPPSAPPRWTDEPVQALRGEFSPQTLRGALAVLLDARSADDLDTLEHFETAMKRLPYHSALAFGERGGQIFYAYVRQRRSVDWAGEEALDLCRNVTGSYCNLVMASGSFRADSFVSFANRLGQAPQGSVRQALLGTMRRNLERGI
ncbi:MAG: serine/threonine protein kinase [Burkholderiaceae bacterium]|nr:serine/threonine protein kinase [Burkholderiaceae bacterium]